MGGYLWGGAEIERGLEGSSGGVGDILLSDLGDDLCVHFVNTH